MISFRRVLKGGKRTKTGVNLTCTQLGAASLDILRTPLSCQKPEGRDLFKLDELGPYFVVHRIVYDYLEDLVGSLQRNECGVLNS
jgi:hypothetical protein